MLDECFRRIAVMMREIFSTNGKKKCVKSVPLCILGSSSAFGIDDNIFVRANRERYINLFIDVFDIQTMHVGFLSF